MKSIEKVSILITGGGSGLGEGAARHFVDAGANVTICGRRREKIDAVAANNDEMAIGAISAIEANGMGGKILVGGVDGTLDALDMLSKGKMTVTIFQDGEGQVTASVDAVKKILSGETVEQEINVPFKLITQDNYKEFM